MRCLTFEALKKSLASTVEVTAMVFLLVIASSVFGQLMAFAGASTALVDWATGIEAAPLIKLLLPKTPKPLVYEEYLSNFCINKFKMDNHEQTQFIAPAPSMGNI